MASVSTAKLNTGATIPVIGFGTWQDKDAQEDAVTEALKAGYRHIDTARVFVVLKSHQGRKQINTSQLWHRASRRSSNQEIWYPEIRTFHHHQTLEQLALP
jgi:diketogulonate reductase-like aldo/keto reductase